MPTRPTCENPECNHALSFHGGKALKLSAHSYQMRAGQCCALGCNCERFEGTDPGLPEWTYAGIGVSEKAQQLSVTEANVRRNAVDLGGVKVDGVWLFPPTP